MAGITLLYIPSDHIVRFVSEHPIDWSRKEMAERGGPGDQAGVTPTPAVEEFLRLLIERRDLFTQDEYMYHCWNQWDAWIRPKPLIQKQGVRAKLFRNFYPSMIDSLHVWAMLSETGAFDTCVLNSTEDAIGKTDLIVTSGNREIRLALLYEGAQNDRTYKLKHRSTSGMDMECVEVVLPKSYPMTPGKKRWYRKHDLMQAILASPFRPTVIKEESVAYQVAGA